MNRWSWWALGIGAYVAFTAATFPAGTAWRWLEPPGTTVAGVAGTLWSGSAARVSIGGFTADTLRWRVRPWSLLLARISASFEARIPDGFVSGNVVASPTTVRFDDVRGATSLPSLAALLPVRGIQGQTSVALETLVLEDGWPSLIVGELKLVELEAPPFVPNGRGTLVPLGTYVMVFGLSPEGELAASILDDGGPLEVAGNVVLDATRSYTLDVLVKPRPGAEDALVEGLKFMTAEPDAEGRRRLSLTGSL